MSKPGHVGILIRNNCTDLNTRQSLLVCSPLRHSITCLVTPESMMVQMLIGVKATIKPLKHVIYQLSLLLSTIIYAQMWYHVLITLTVLALSL